jgi:rhamnose transport system substrate-binding protein
MLAYELSKNGVTAESGADVPMGRMGTLTLDDKTEGAMADPCIYDASNIDDFKSIF